VLRVLSVTVPAEDVGAMHELLSMLRMAKDEAASREGAEPDELPVLDELIHLAGRQGEGHAPLELSGPAGLIRDAAYGLLLDGVDALADACRSYEAGRSSLGELVEAGEAAARRLALMKAVEESDGWSAD
jgi:hypothetical protein